MLCCLCVLFIESSDPFVEIICGKKNIGKTKIIKKSENPVWNETFECDVADCLRHHIQMVIKDHDSLSDDLVGKVVVHFSDICRKNGEIRDHEFAVIGSKTGCKLYATLEYRER